MATGLVGGLFDLFSGDPTRAEQGKFGALSDEQVGAGEGATSKAETYDENLLTNPTLALAPEIGAGQNQVQQQKLQDANFGTRSGGTTASTAAAEAGNRTNIIDLMAREQGKAADTLGTLGLEQTGQGATALGNEAELANQRRQQQVGDINGVAQGAASIAEGLIPGAGAIPGAAPTADPAESLYDAQNYGSGGAPLWDSTDTISADPNLSL